MGYLVHDHGDSGWFTYLKVVEVLSIVAAIQGALFELRPGYGLAYSKFTSESRNENRQLPSRIGMFIIYSPPALVAAWFFADQLLHNTGWRENDTGSLKVLLVSAAMCVHFVKRVLETLFLHHYSGKIGLSSSIFIAIAYSVSTANLNLAQQKSEQLTPPALDLTWVGVGLFLIGILGNFYHHLLLRGLRKGGEST